MNHGMVFGSQVDILDLPKPEKYFKNGALVSTHQSKMTKILIKVLLKIKQY